TCTGNLVLVQVWVDHHAGVAVEDAVLVKGIADALDHAAVDLAFERQRVDRPATIVDGDDALDLDHAGLRIDGHLRELHAARAAGVIMFVVTLPPEPGPCGNDVSPIFIVMSDGFSPSSSATTCASAVRIPPPMSCTPESSSTEPSRVMRTSQCASRPPKRYHS